PQSPDSRLDAPVCQRAGGTGGARSGASATIFHALDFPRCRYKWDGRRSFGPERDGTRATAGRAVGTDAVAAVALGLRRAGRLDRWRWVASYDGRLPRPVRCVAL